MKCLFFFHNDKMCIYHYYDASWGGKAPSTKIIKVCQRCHRIKQESHYGVGFLTAEQLGLPKDTQFSNKVK